MECIHSTIRVVVYLRSRIISAERSWIWNWRS